jgi:hypothetical protein
MAFSVAAFVNILNAAGGTGSQKRLWGGRIRPVPGSKLSADVGARAGGRQLFLDNEKMRLMHLVHLGKLEGGDWPLAIVAFDRNSQAMPFVEPNVSVTISPARRHRAQLLTP